VGAAWLWLSVLAVSVWAQPVAKPATTLPASRYVLTAWTTAQGLTPPGDIRAIAQDKAGFLWLGTTTGLVRFDGFEFTLWGTRGEDALPGTFIRSLAATRDGALWVGFGDATGVVRIDGRRLTRYDGAPAAPPGGPPGPISQLFQQGDGTLWAGGRDGLAWFRNGVWQLATPAIGVPTAEVYTMLEDSKGGLWAGTAAGVLRRPAGAAAFAVFDASLTFVQGFAEDGGGTIWAGDTQQIIRSLTSSARPEHGDDVRLPTPGWQLLSDVHGDLWIAALGGGLLRIRQPERPRPQIERVSYEGTLTGSPQVIFQDADANIWVGMRGGGLLRLSEAVVRTDTRLEGLTNDGVRAMTAGSDGSVWVGTGHSINVFSKGRHQAFPISQTMALHADVRGQVWAVTHEGLGRIENGRFVPVMLPNRLRFEYLTSMTSDTTGDLWMCTGEDGVVRFDGRTLNRFDEARGASGRACTFAFGDSHGRVWFGFARGGVAVYEEGRFRSFGERDGLASGTVMAIYEDQRHDVWISMTSGLSRFDDGRFTTVGRQNGLPEGIVPSMIEDAEGSIWVGANSGSALIRFTHDEVDRVAKDPSHQMQYSLYDVSDGLGGAIHWWSHPSAVRGENGLLWFVTGTGVAVVDPRALPSGRRQTRPRIERVLVDGQPQTPGAELVFSPDTQALQIEYGALGLSGSSKFRFRYRLEGLGSDWVDAGPRRVASYTNLPPGRYEFRVSATTDGAWSEAPAVLAFTLRAPFYRTAGFYMLCAVAIALLLWAYWWSRMSAARTQFALVLDERARMSREIHDTLLQDLGAIGLELDVLASRLEPPQDSVREGLQDLRRQVSRCLRSARQSIWELRSPRRDDRGLVTGFEGLARDAQSRSSAAVHVSVQGTPRRCSEEVEEQLLRIGQEAINNAVRHGQAGRIEVNIDYRGDEVGVTVSDDGVGFATDTPPQRKSGHWGLLTMHERAASIRARFAISSTIGRGTRVETIAPVTPL
jgi:signal transduction histidine kinase/ligand-binding sensor domain-containing protein